MPRSPPGSAAGRYASTISTRQVRRSRGRAPRAGRARAGRASGSPRARSRAAPRAPAARRQSTSSPSSEVLRSLASNAGGEVVVGDGQVEEPRSSGARAARAGSIARQRDLERPAPARPRSGCRPGRTASTRSRARRSSWCWRRRTGTRRSRPGRRARARCARIPPPAATCRCRPRPRCRRCARARRAPASRWRRAVPAPLRRPTIGCSLAACRRDACRFEPVSANTGTGSALPLTVIGASFSHGTTSPGGAPDRLRHVDLAGRRLAHQARRQVAPRRRGR